ncbi:MAG: PIG-L family deacetylase [Dehalococcoidia bacterium]|nr:PIG-L family deacetylase [Dehalococcoidia bacterium]
MNGTNLQPLDEDWNIALAVVAHPDALEYGAASAISKWTSEGKRVVYLLATSGEAGIDGMTPEETAKVRVQEEIAGAAIVGVDIVEFLDHTDGIVEYGPELRRDIARAIRAHKPDVVLTINFDLRFSQGFANQADHRAVGLAALDASRDAGNRWIFPELLDEGLEPWNGVKALLVNASPNATHAVDVGDHIYKGVESLEKHEKYIQGLGSDVDPEMMLTMNANATGIEFGCDYAVSFEVFDL